MTKSTMNETFEQSAQTAETIDEEISQNMADMGTGKEKERYDEAHMTFEMPGPIGDKVRRQSFAKKQTKIWMDNYQHLKQQDIDREAEVKSNTHLAPEDPENYIQEAEQHEAQENSFLDNLKDEHKESLVSHMENHLDDLASQDIEQSKDQDQGIEQ